ncbi:glycerate kinase, partial [Chloroflexota bacterium]
MKPESIVQSPYGEAILSIQTAAMAAVNPREAVRRQIRRDGNQLFVAGEGYDLDAFQRVLVVGGGKAATAMASAVYSVFGDRLTGGLVVTKYGHRDSRLDTGPVEVLEGGHPVPDEAGVAGTRRMLEQLVDLSERDLVLTVISGGGSALLTQPAPGLTLADLQRTTDLLLCSGATIVELNTVRKHLSAIKGGQLARRADPATVIGLVLSDVVGDPLDAIASGPTVPDPTTFEDAWAVLKRYSLLGRVPPPVRTRIRSGAGGAVLESPKPG